MASSIATLLDLQVEQRSLTAEKIIRASDKLSNRMETASLSDFNVLLQLDCDGPVSKSEAQNLINSGFCAIDDRLKVILTPTGRSLIEEMGLTPRPMKRLKLSGSDALELVDKMFSELD